MFIDTHCHLDDPSLYDRLPQVLASARQAGVGRFVVPSVAPDGWDKIADLASAQGEIYAAFGLHPMHAHLFHEELLADLKRHAGKGVAIGEVGLDYLLDEIPRDLQLQAFSAQVGLAVEMGLPLLIHCRRAFQDLLRVLREEQAEKVGGIMHAFSGSAETARECMELSFVISVAGPVTYRNAVKPLDLVRELPLNRLVLETDAPDMTPEPFRGVLNEPAFLLATAKKVAEIKGASLDEVAAVTTRNAERALRI